MKPFISACLIVKNEEDMLRKCLESLQPVVDEIIIVDTGSTDSTKQISKEFTEKVFDYKWTNDFAEARNFAATKAESEWIIAIDADECVDPDNFREALQIIKNQMGKYDMYAVEILSFLGSMAENITTNKMGRVYKNDGTVYFEGAIHEQLVTKDKEQQLILSPIILYHYGYLKHVVEKQDKKNRNLNIIKKKLQKNENDGFLYFNYGQELRRLGKVNEALDNFIKAYKYKETAETSWSQTCLYFIVEILVGLKRYEEALNIIKDAESIWPAAPDFVFWKGDIYFLQGQYDDAKEIYKSIISNQTTYSEIIHHFDRKSFLPKERLGLIFELEKNDEQALKYYIEALNENGYSIKAILSVVRILSKHHTAEEIYEFIHAKKIIKSDDIRTELIKVMLTIGLKDLSLLLVKDFDVENKLFIGASYLKANIINEELMEDGWEPENLLYGVQCGLIDFPDLCILYEMTNEKSVKKIIEQSNYSDAFKCLFASSNERLKIQKKTFLSVLGRAISYNKPNFTEKLINLNNRVYKNSDAEIADIFYVHGYEDIALELYQQVDEKHITKQGYENIIRWLIEQENFEEAHRISLKAINKFKKDFRFYKYAIESDGNKGVGIIEKAKKQFADSKWLKGIEERV
ncbi:MULTISPECIES: tetratricopeptide repeat-containing glycosyltransferase family 2 protein [Bacillus]|uniref:tetratricopeptide repeat-containing glycosyltransferase family 2 protein n=1 Tax=Bacillus TaxID=1386 RepID=UPI00148F3410|nr:glycosyltransferase family 2 protein [Bacillus paranthracis]NOP82277.1 glycosyltransferase [Bacillus paranthracis]